MRVTRTSWAKPWAALCAVISGCLLVGLVPLAHADTAPNAFYGTWADSLSYSGEATRAEMDRQKANGIGLLRQYVWWDRIETSPGVFDWARTDQMVADATARGLRILPTLLYTPSFYSSKPADSTSRSAFPPSDPEDMANFAAAMVHRYGPGGTYWCKPASVPGLPPTCKSPSIPITMWEVWNEPDYPSWWKSHPNAAEYLELLKAVHDGIKEADPSAQVVLGALTNEGGGNNGDFLEELYQLGAKDYFDILSHNPYGRDVGSMVAFMRGERAIADRYGDSSKPILITEWGWATGGSSPYIVTDETCQAALLYAGAKRLYELRSELNLIGVTQFQWHDLAGGGTAWPFYAGVIRGDGTAKPGLETMRAAIAGEPVPAGYTLNEACPADRRSLDGTLKTLTVARAGAGTGSIKSSPSGIDCPNTCSHQFQPDYVVTLTATPDADSHVVWKGATCSGNTCTVTMDRSRTVTAAFEQLPTAGTYQENSSRVEYIGAWATAKGQDLGGSRASATKGPASATLYFRGTGVAWISRRSPSSGIGKVFIDGVQVASVDRYASTQRLKVQVFKSADLAFGDHNIRIEYTGKKNSKAMDDNLMLDAFIVR
jgi:hypothetical protein